MNTFLDNLETFNEIDYIRTLLSFVCCIILSFCLKFVYQEKSISLSISTLLCHNEGTVL